MTKQTYVRVGGVWKPCTNILVRAGGVWKSETMPSVRVSGQFKECMEYGFNVGDIGPAGGLIIYKKAAYSDGWMYLELAPKTWYNGSDDPTGIPWGCVGLDIIGLPDFNFFTLNGYENTQLIANQCTQNPIAAKVANNLSFGGYSDWYLPSVGELHVASPSSGSYYYVNWPAAFAVLSTRRYWTATPGSGTYKHTNASAYVFSEYGGSSSITRDSTTRYIRPIRRF